jgi:hypothetical protein
MTAHPARQRHRRDRVLTIWALFAGHPLQERYDAFARGVLNHPPEAGFLPSGPSEQFGQAFRFGFGHIKTSDKVIDGLFLWTRLFHFLPVETKRVAVVSGYLAEKLNQLLQLVKQALPYRMGRSTPVTANPNDTDVSEARFRRGRRGEAAKSTSEPPHQVA